MHTPDAVSLFSALVRAVPSGTHLTTHREQVTGACRSSRILGISKRFRANAGDRGASPSNARLRWLELTCKCASFCRRGAWVSASRMLCCCTLDLCPSVPSFSPPSCSSVGFLYWLEEQSEVQGNIVMVYGFKFRRKTHSSGSSFEMLSWFRAAWFASVAVRCTSVGVFICKETADLVLDQTGKLLMLARL